jgi:Tfp pilus assembly protein PilN
MINLLPDDTKRDIEAARTNVLLFRYNILTIVGLAGLALICAAFYVVLNMNESSSVTKSNDNSSKAAAYNNVRKAADDYRQNLTIANQILNNSVNYTSVVFAITKLLPQGVVLDSLNLKAADFGKQITFSTHAKSYAQATQLKENFQKSNMFTNVYFQNITQATDAQATGAYPFAVDLSAQLNKTAMQQ